MGESIDIKRVQNVLLEMASSAADILESHSIPYMIAYGTLLGAVRHKGFIPWDDDFDFILFDDTYDAAIEILRNELPKSMFLEDSKSEPLYFHGWAHVKDMYSSVYCSQFPQDGAYVHKGIGLDLYRTKEMPLSELQAYLNDENRSYLARRKTKGLITDDEYNRRMSLINDDAEIIGANEDARVFCMVEIGSHMRAEDVLPLKKIRFEDREFSAPNDPDKILTGIYGDYMKLPPVEKRLTHYSRVDFIGH